MTGEDDDKPHVGGRDYRDDTPTQGEDASWLELEEAEIHAPQPALVPTPLAEMYDHIPGVCPCDRCW